MHAQFEAVVLNQIRKNFDEPIPQFRGKRLRGLARGASSRADAIVPLLVRHLAPWYNQRYNENGGLDPG